MVPRVLRELGPVLPVPPLLTFHPCPPGHGYPSALPRQTGPTRCMSVCVLRPAQLHTAGGGRFSSFRLWHFLVLEHPELWVFSVVGGRHCPGAFFNLLGLPGPGHAARSPVDRMDK